MTWILVLNAGAWLVLASAIGAFLAVSARRLRSETIVLPVYVTRAPREPMKAR